MKIKLKHLKADKGSSVIERRIENEKKKMKNKGRWRIDNDEAEEK